MRVVGDLVELTDRQAFDNEYHGVSDTNIRNLVFNVSKYSQKKKLSYDSGWRRLYYIPANSHRGAGSRLYIAVIVPYSSLTASGVERINM